MENQSYSLTVCILSYNRKEELQNTLLKMDYLNTWDEVEIIVVDNDSNDGSKDMISKEFPNVVLVENDENIGVAAWNEGFANAKGKYILALDDDADIEESFLEQALGYIGEDENIGIISFNVKDKKNGNSFTTFMPYGIFSFWGCAVLFTQEFLIQSNGIDKNIFLYSHEIDIAFKALKLKYTHSVMINIEAYHRKNGGYCETEFSLSNRLFSEVYSYSKHLHFPFILKYFTNLILMYISFSKGKKMKFKVILLNQIMKAIKSGKQNSFKKNSEIEKLIIQNDLRVNFFILLLKSKVLRLEHKKVLNDFFIKRKKYFPDFIEGQLMTWTKKNEI